jgi:hypothetical protein
VDQPARLLKRPLLDAATLRNALGKSQTFVEEVSAHCSWQMSWLAWDPVWLVQRWNKSLHSRQVHCAHSVLSLGFTPAYSVADRLLHLDALEQEALVNTGLPTRITYRA